MLDCSAAPVVQRCAAARSPYRLGLYRLSTRAVPAARLLGLPNLRQQDLPLCSFGPGGSYLVDWYPHRYRPESSQEDDAATNASHDQTGPALTPLALLGAEIRDWFRGIHPGRVRRVETHPECFIPCRHCGTVDTWQPWRQKISGPRQRGWNRPAALVGHRPHHSLVPADPAASAIPTWIPHLSEVSVDQCNPQTTRGSAGVAEFSQSAWLFADHAGTRRPAPSFKGYRVRARGSARTKKTVAAGTAQGSLFEC